MSGAMELPPPSDASSGDEPSFVRLLFTTPLGELARGRVTGPAPHFVRTQVSQAHLPATVQVFVEDVVRHTRLWRSEKREIARELAAHFADGLEAGRSADQLITDFGDPGQAALLLRRAAKRNRPWPWQAARFTLRATAVFLVALIGVYAILTLRFYLARQGPIADFRPAMNAAALSVSETDKAWPLYRQALLAMPDRMAVESTLINKRGYMRLPHPGEEGWDFVAESLEKWKPALEFARQAADKPGFGLVVGYPWSVEDSKLFSPHESPMSDGLGLIERDGLIGVLLPHLGHMRNLALALGWDTERAANAGEGDLALTNIRTLISMSRHMRETPTLINALVSLAVMSLTCERVNWAVANHADAFNESQLAEMAHLIAAMNDREMQIDFSGERMFFHDAMQRIYSDDGHGDGRVTAKGLEWLHSMTAISGPGRGEEQIDFMMQFGGPAVSAIMLSRRDMFDEHARLMDTIEAEAIAPLWEREKPKTDVLVEQWMSSPLERLRRYPLTLLLPALSRASVNAELAMMHRDVTLTAIALEMHHRRHGNWPDSLDQLVPHLLPDVPVDRFDGQPLRYTLRDGRPLLYSVGTDREDDGGVLPPTMRMGMPRQWDARFWIPRDKIEEARKVTGPRPNGQRGPAWDGDWILWPPQDEGPVRRDDPPTAP